METETSKECPKCGSDKIKTIGMTYPKAYECEICNYRFVKGKQSLIDEG